MTDAIMTAVVYREGAMGVTLSLPHFGQKGMASCILSAMGAIISRAFS